MKKVAIYTRCSTTKDRQSTESQTHALRTFCQNREWDIVSKYEDFGSGADNKRPEFQRLKQDSFKREFDIVLVFRFDRFARSTKELLESLEYFQSLGIEFVSYSEQIDTTTPAGKALFSIVGIFAEFERNIASERIKAGLEKAKSKGKKLGRPKVHKMKLEDEIISCLQDGNGKLKTSQKLGVSKSHVEKVKKKRKDDFLQTTFFSQVQ